MAWDFRPGMLVVCIGPRDGWKLLTGIRSRVDPVVGCVYTICDVKPLRDLLSPGTLVHPPEAADQLFLMLNGLGEGWWEGVEFKPARDTSIGVFTALLNKTPELV